MTQLYSYPVLISVPVLFLVKKETQKFEYMKYAVLFRAHAQVSFARNCKTDARNELEFDDEN